MPSLSLLNPYLQTCLSQTYLSPANLSATNLSNLSEPLHFLIQLVLLANLQTNFLQPCLIFQSCSYGFSARQLHMVRFSSLRIYGAASSVPNHLVTDSWVLLVLVCLMIERFCQGVLQLFGTSCHIQHHKHMTTCPGCRIEAQLSTIEVFNFTIQIYMEMNGGAITQSK